MDNMKCDQCGGSGKITLLTSKVDCEKCGGSGEVAAADGSSTAECSDGDFGLLLLNGPWPNAAPKIPEIGAQYPTEYPTPRHASVPFSRLLAHELVGGDLRRSDVVARLTEIIISILPAKVEVVGSRESCITDEIAFWLRGEGLPKECECPPGTIPLKIDMALAHTGGGKIEFRGFGVRKLDEPQSQYKTFSNERGSDFDRIAELKIRRNGAALSDMERAAWRVMFDELYEAAIAAREKGHIVPIRMEHDCEQIQGAGPIAAHRRLDSGSVTIYLPGVVNLKHFGEPHQLRPPA